jgi:hypothetical protein
MGGIQERHPLKEKEEEYKSRNFTTLGGTGVHIRQLLDVVTLTLLGHANGTPLPCRGHLHVASIGGII